MGHLISTIIYGRTRKRIAHGLVKILSSAMDAPRKSVLFCMGGRNRIGSSAGTGVFVSDKSALTAAVRAQFGDILSEKQDFFLQIKNEDWGGAFVELLEEQNVPDKAVIEAVIVPKSIEVCFVHV